MGLLAEACCLGELIKVWLVQLIETCLGELIEGWLGELIEP